MPLPATSGCSSSPSPRTWWRAWFRPRSATAEWFQTGVILGDTWITLALVWSGHFSSDFIHIYFFVHLLAAIGENLSLSGWPL